jgi:hypothetical protein
MNITGLNGLSWLIIWKTVLSLQFPQEGGNFVTEEAFFLFEGICLRMCGII